MFIELVNVTEDVDRNANILLNYDFFSGLDADKQAEVYSALLVLAREQLMRDYEGVLGGSDVVEVSPDPEHRDYVMVLRLLASEDLSEFQCLVYFGGRIKSGLLLSDGLFHALQVVATLES